ncbi:LysR family transcriptional regulator [Oceanobacillus profundus]|uniref:LysR family transcriptional regulator n=1 Tax=Oceanobacillus profundus TaxID=372463 RepID=A0A417YDE7_9BACI|nr:LysR family transcriptional regulator [Oceanobacillus profundus]MBR3117884.1 LysR family transcriptional regulator [Oceanobacillus sp.]MDO6451494.1 LysR family transcriptional regulator [Oceanobacillus profundus]RHW30657.1 LysR family transcriptional regulator [Oceanobacillus profundus]
MATITQLHIFSKVIEIGNFTKAGQALKMTQPAVSQAVSSLEAELGVSLLIRDKSRGLILTDIGEKILLQIRTIENSLKIIDQEVAAEKGLETGTIKVAGFPDVSARFLPKIIQAIQQKYPNITIELFEGSVEEVFNWITSRMVDIGFIYSPHSSLDIIPLVEDKYMAVFPPEHHLLKKSLITLSDLSNESLIVGKWGDPKAIEQLFIDKGLPYHQKYTVSNLNTMLGMIQERLGLSILPELAIKDTEMWKYARPILTDYRRNIALAAISLQHVSRATKLFIDIVKEQVN